jgi:hypothetical protein
MYFDLRHSDSNIPLMSSFPRDACLYADVARKTSKLGNIAEVAIVTLILPGAIHLFAYLLINLVLAMMGSC